MRKRDDCFYYKLQGQMRSSEKNLHKFKDMNDSYAKLEQKTQYLTHIKRFNQGHKKVPLNLAQFDVHLQSLYYVIIQVCYLLFSSYMLKIPIFISKELYIKKERTSESSKIYHEYILEEEIFQVDIHFRERIKADYQYVGTEKSQSLLSQAMFKRLGNYIEMMLKLLNDPKKKVIKNKNWQKEVRGLQIVMKFLAPLLNRGLKARILLKCLEETQIFQKYSLILRAVNTSVYESISTNSSRDLIMREVVARQKKSCSLWKVMVNQNALDSNLIIEEIDSMIFYFVNKEIMNVNISLSTQEDELGKRQKKIHVGNIVNEGNQVKAVWNIFIQTKEFNEFNEQLLKKILKGEKIGKTRLSDNQKKFTQFMIDYYLSRHIMKIKYVSEVTLKPQNYDQVIQIASKLRSEQIDVELEEVEGFSREQGKKESHRWKALTVSLRTSYRFQNDPYRHLLYIIDQVMVYGTVLEYYFEAKSFMLIQASQVQNQIKHLLKLFEIKKNLFYDHFLKLS